MLVSRGLKKFQEKFNEIMKHLHHFIIFDKVKKKTNKKSKVSSIFQWSSRGNKIVIQNKELGEGE